MKRLLIIALAVSALFLSCDPNAGSDSGINGKWVLSTVDGASVNAPPLTGLYSVTLTISNETTYTVTGTIFGFAYEDSGTVTKKSDTVYTLTNAYDESTDYTLDGDKLSYTEVDEDDPSDTTVYVFKRD